MNLFLLRYRIPSARWALWDYHSPGYYFVTICTRNRMDYFGTIINGHLDLSPIGKIAEFELIKTAKIRDNVFLHEWIIMPNHIHAIIRILPSSNDNHNPRQPQNNRFGPQSDNLAAIVRGFKSAVKKWTNLYGLEFHWQMRFHDHIIRDEDELKRIQWYVLANPRIWKSDSLNR